MRLLVFNAAVLDSIARIRLHAENNIFSTEDLKAVMRRSKISPGDLKEFTTVIPDGYRVVFSFEHQPNVGLCRHLSVSIPDPDKRPSPEAVTEIMAKFGFRNQLSDQSPTLTIWMDGLAINVLEVMGN